MRLWPSARNRDQQLHTYLQSSFADEDHNCMCILTPSVFKLLGVYIMQQTSDVFFLGIVQFMSRGNSLLNRKGLYFLTLWLCHSVFFSMLKYDMIGFCVLLSLVQGEVFLVKPVFHLEFFFFRNMTCQYNSLFNFYSVIF